MIYIYEPLAVFKSQITNSGAYCESNDSFLWAFGHFQEPDDQLRSLFWDMIYIFEPLVVFKSQISKSGANYESNDSHQWAFSCFKSQMINLGACYENIE